ncbi:OmpP1/FadL family transporter [Roseovarius sp.]|uniref:OmpP1/FadL family transporter n=1 Tax=Roseovarius sp. TaxID=1486281 RepID=UPI003A977929
MKTTWLAATLLATTASMAFGGEIERRGDPSMILFEKGKNYLEFSAATVKPSVSGAPLPTIPTSGTGNIQERYQSFAGGYKRDVNDRLSLALVIDEPVGAAVDYRTPGSFFAGSNAEVSSVAFTGLAKYKATDRVSVYGGLRYIGLSGNITVISPATLGSAIPAPGQPYTLNVNKDFQFGYLLGAAYEIPDIALRVALTYESKTEHDFKDNTGAPFKVEIPQAFTLHAQSGIAANTLLFGSVKWREWSQFSVQPGDFFSVATGVPVNVPIASGPSDIWTYELGLGRKFNENWSGAVILGYEKDEGDIVGNLSGKDGYFSYGLAATYETDSWKFTAGVKYFDVGDANSSVTAFSGNDAIAIGTKVAFKF